jgi:hypothetical protein
MNHVPSNPRLTRGFTFVALAVTLALSAVSLTQCRLIDNSVTGPERTNQAFHGGGRSRCEHRCNQAYKRCDEAEDRRFAKEMRECDKIRDKKKRRECKEAEERRHRNEQAECVREKKACKRNCNYREGSGGGGR